MNAKRCCYRLQLCCCGYWVFVACSPIQVNEFLAGAGTDAPDVEEEENITSRPSVTYDDLWAKSILETYEAEVP